MELSKPHCILIDQSGKRYMNEAGSYIAAAKNILNRDKTVRAVPSWMIADSQYFKRYLLSGSLPRARGRERWITSKFLKRASNLGELARECDIDPSALERTVARFNRFAEAGRDEDFHRGERAYDRWLGDGTHKAHATLGKIDSPPFYAVQVYPGDVSTYGGLVTDEKARVLRDDKSVIEGLYATGATGTSTASVMGRFYPGAGSSVGPSFTWAYIAAKHALETGKSSEGSEDHKAVAV
jgi:3-oxosteroid 1-dehydrogenase